MASYRGSQLATLISLPHRDRHPPPPQVFIAAAVACHRRSFSVSFTVGFLSAIVDRDPLSPSCCRISLLPLFPSGGSRSDSSDSGALSWVWWFLQAADKVFRVGRWWVVAGVLHFPLGFRDLGCGLFPLKAFWRSPRCRSCLSALLRDIYVEGLAECGSGQI